MGTFCARKRCLPEKCSVFWQNRQNPSHKYALEQKQISAQPLSHAALQYTPF